jgi:hypothetical protein
VPAVVASRGEVVVVVLVEARLVDAEARLVDAEAHSVAVVVRLVAVVDSEEAVAVAVEDSIDSKFRHILPL